MPARGGRGFALAEFVVGTAVGLLVIVAALSLTRGLLELTHAVSQSSDRQLAVSWALDRIAADLGRCGIGVMPSHSTSFPDEGVELFTASSFACRYDADRDNAVAARDPESSLRSAAAATATANDEIVVYVRRNAGGGGRVRAVFDADLDSADRFTAADGTRIARRDGVAEAVDAGPAAEAGESAGVLYRVTFVHDATRFGTGRFRSVQPLLDDVGLLSFRAFDRRGDEVRACGGGDDAGSRACRARIAHVQIGIQAGRAFRARDVAVPRSLETAWEAR